jgi:hypothetical protein
MKPIRFFIFLCLGLVACQPIEKKLEERYVARSFYYWKSTFELDSQDVKVMDSLKVRKLYVKVFDVVWDEFHRGMPVAQLNWKSNFSFDLEIVPVVYITNEVILNTKEEEISVLASRIHKKINQIMGARNLCGKLSDEVQIDCDWNLSSRDKYFMLLKELKYNIKTLSATIRLHQIKYYAKTGVPPVDKGMLMFYNMRPVYNLDVKNSILDTDEAKKYISDTLHYPLNLDFALPVFSWGVLFRANKFVGLINYMDKGSMSKYQFFSKKLDSENLYICNADTVHGDYFFRRGDMLRIEEPNLKEIESGKEILAPLILSQKKINITLFHWDKSIIDKYSHEKLDKAFRCYR